MRISDWSSDVCSSDLDFVNEHTSALGSSLRGRAAYGERLPRFLEEFRGLRYEVEDLIVSGERAAVPYTMSFTWTAPDGTALPVAIRGMFRFRVVDGRIAHLVDYRSEEHTSALQSLMSTSYAVFCLEKKKTNTLTEDT